MNKAGTILCLLTITLSASAADTKLAKNLDGNCSISVPADWSTDSLGGAQSSDKKVNLTVSSPKHGLTSLAQVHQLAPTVYHDDKVTKDTATEFMMEGTSINGKPNVYRAVPAGDKVCIVDIQYENNDAAAARAIAQTLKPTK
jgi:hypothetical protein